MGDLVRPWLSTPRGRRLGGVPPRGLQSCHEAAPVQPETLEDAQVPHVLKLDLRAGRFKLRAGRDEACAGQGEALEIPNLQNHIGSRRMPGRGPASQEGARSLGRSS